MRRRSGLWSDRDFLAFWGSQTVSQFGSQITFLALPLVAILVLKESTFRVAVLTSVEFLPFLLFTLPAGVWVDRLRRRPILIGGDVVRAVALLTIPLAYWLDALTIWQLYAVAFVHGVGTVFFDLAYQSYLPVLVGRQQLVDGNAKLETSRSVATIGGPGFAGGLVSALTAPIAILADAISFVVSAFLLGAISKPEAPPPREERRSMKAELGEGLRYVLTHRYPARRRRRRRALELLRAGRLLDPARGVIPFGGLAGGALGSTIGLRETMVLGGLGGLLAVVPILLSPVRSVGRMSEVEIHSEPIASASSAPA